LNEARDDGVAVASTGPCTSFASLSRQINMPSPHHSDFTGQMLFLTPSQQCRNAGGILAEAN